MFDLMGRFKRKSEQEAKAAEREALVLWTIEEQRRRERERAEAIEQMLAIQKEQARLAREQEREAMERKCEDERLAKEQEKQAAQLAEHEKRIADLEFRMSQAESDIEFLNNRIAQLDAQRDFLMLQQSGTVPGGKEHTKYQTKIISIENQIHTAENKLNKARHIKAMAEKEMEVA